MQVNGPQSSCVLWKHGPRRLIVSLTLDRPRLTGAQTFLKVLPLTWVTKKLKVRCLPTFNASNLQPKYVKTKSTIK